MSDLAFARPEYLWGSLASLLLFGVFWILYHQRQRTLRSFAEKKPLQVLTGETSPLRYFLRAMCLTLAVALLLVAMSEPKFGKKPVPVQRRGVDLIIALDVSASMNTMDVSPSRLHRARISIESLLNRLSGDRIGLVAFAGEAVLLHPLTTRAAGFLITLDTLDTNAVAVPGTAIGEALERAREALEERTLKHRVMILITDGENHDEEALRQAELAAKEGITIFTLGIGTPDGEPVPENVNGDNVEYKKENGRYVISQLNADLLQRIAEIGNGSFYHFTGEEDVLNRLYDQIAEMGEEQEESTDKKELMNDIYQIPLAVAVLLFGFTMVIGDRRRKGNKT